MGRAKEERNMSKTFPVIIETNFSFQQYQFFCRYRFIIDIKCTKINSGTGRFSPGICSVPNY
jgi:hypothetical protein